VVVFSRWAAKINHAIKEQLRRHDQRGHGEGDGDERERSRTGIAVRRSVAQPGQRRGS
jgi:hypothetical protein